MGFIKAFTGAMAQESIVDSGVNQTAVTAISSIGRTLSGSESV